MILVKRITSAVYFKPSNHNMNINNQHNTNKYH